MENILYLDDYINLYNKNLNKIIISKPYKNTLKYGKIINREKFIKIFNKIKEENNLNNHILSEKISVIINSNYTVEERTLLKDVLEDLNYKNVVFINEIKLLNIDKKELFINFNETYFYFYYINDLGNVILKMYDNDELNRRLIKEMLRIINLKNIVIMGKNINELINIIKNFNYNYLYYEDSSNLLIKLFLNKL